MSASGEVKIPHTVGKCVNCRGIYYSFNVSSRMGCLEYRIYTFCMKKKIRLYAFRANAILGSYQYFITIAVVPTFCAWEQLGFKSTPVVLLPVVISNGLRAARSVLHAWVQSRIRPHNHRQLHQFIGCIFIIAQQ